MCESLTRYPGNFKFFFRGKSRDYNMGIIRIFFRSRYFSQSRDSKYNVTPPQSKYPLIPPPPPPRPPHTDTFKARRVISVIITNSRLYFSNIKVQLRIRVFNLRLGLVSGLGLTSGLFMVKALSQLDQLLPIWCPAPNSTDLGAS